MYSPKISEELVPRLYRLAKTRKMPMTRLVDAIIREAVGTSDHPVSGAEGTDRLCAPASEPRKAAA